MSDLIERFRSLHNEFGRTLHIKRYGFRRAQIELFQLAQAIAQIHCPRIQQELTDVRTEIMEELTNGLDHISFSDAVMAPSTCTRHLWSDYQITPEVSIDPRLTGRIVNRKLVVRLSALRRRQIAFVLKIAGL